MLEVYAVVLEDGRGREWSRSKTVVVEGACNKKSGLLKKQA